MSHQSMTCGCDSPLGITCPLHYELRQRMTQPVLPVVYLEAPKLAYMREAWNQFMRPGVPHPKIIRVSRQLHRAIRREQLALYGEGYNPVSYRVYRDGLPFKAGWIRPDKRLVGDQVRFGFDEGDV